MKSRFRLAVATAALALVAAFAAGCATGGARQAASDASAPVADAEWKSLVKSGRGCFQRNDFKAALPLFASAANRSRALDDPNGLAVALLNQARCLEEMEIADILATREKVAAKGAPAVVDNSYLSERMRLLDELLALRSDTRLSARRRAELDVAVAALPRPPDEARADLAAIVERTHPDLLSPADRARLLLARVAPLDPGDPAACAFLNQCPPDAEIPPSLRARRQIMLMLYCGADELAALESAAAIYREAGRADGVAFALSCVKRPDARPSDPVHAADMLLRGAAACHALGYVHLAASLLDRAEAFGDPAIRERSAALRASLRLPSATPPTEPKGEPQP